MSNCNSPFTQGNRKQLILVLLVKILTKTNYEQLYIKVPFHSMRLLSDVKINTAAAKTENNLCTSSSVTDRIIKLDIDFYAFGFADFSEISLGHAQNRHFRKARFLVSKSKVATSRVR